MTARGRILGEGQFLAFCDAELLTVAVVPEARRKGVGVALWDAARDGLGCDYHPSRKTAERMATQLASAMKPALGW